MWGKMTPVAQLSDTTSMFPLKRYLHGEQGIVRRGIKAMHEDQGTELSYKCGYYELLRMITRAVDKTDEFMDHPAESRTLRDTVRNGCFVYMPNYETGKLERAEDQEWCKRIGAKAGNMRKNADWTTDRYSWLDSNGKPIGPFAEGPKGMLHEELKHHKKAPELDEAAGEQDKTGGSRWAG